MKSLYDLSEKITEQEYRDIPAYSYSILSKFNREGFDCLSTLYDKIDTPSITFGSVVDTLLTEGSASFDTKFIVSNNISVSSTIEQIVYSLFNKYSTIYSKLEDIPDEIISEEGILAEYYVDSKYNSSRVKKIRNEGSELYNFLYLAKDKKIISETCYRDALKCVDALKKDPIISHYFEDSQFNTTIEKFYQLKFKGEYDGIPLKMMADLIIVNHEDKVIIPCDLKTTSKKEWKFYESFVKYGYWIQAQLYWYILNSIISKDDFYKDYTLLDFRFIVINRESLSPLVWIYSGTTNTETSIFGKNKEYTLTNWRSILKDLVYYQENPSDFPIGIKKVNDIVEWLDK